MLPDVPLLVRVVPSDVILTSEEEDWSSGVDITGALLLSELGFLILGVVSLWVDAEDVLDDTEFSETS